MFTDLLLKVLRLLFADKKTGELQVKYSREITMTGFSEEEDIENRKNKLKHLCHEVVDNSGFDARDITGDGKAETFCNQANAYIANSLGCEIILADNFANEQIDAARGSIDFTIGSPKEAAKHALQGGYGFAGLRGEVHGHVAVLYPLSCGESGKWGEVPYVAHVGKPPNGIRKVSESFIVSGQRPDYYLFKFKEL